MGKLRITDQGLKLYYGEAEFVNELRANLIRPSQVISYDIYTIIIFNLVHITQCYWYEKLHMKHLCEIL